MTGTVVDQSTLQHLLSSSEFNGEGHIILLDLCTIILSLYLHIFRSSYLSVSAGAIEDVSDNCKEAETIVLCNLAGFHPELRFGGGRDHGNFMYCVFPMTLFCVFGCH